MVSHTSSHKLPIPSGPGKPEPGTLQLRGAGYLSKVTQPELAELGYRPDAQPQDSRDDATTVDNDGQRAGPGVPEIQKGALLGTGMSLCPQPRSCTPAWVSLLMLLLCFPFCIFMNVSAQLFCPEAL